MIHALILNFPSIVMRQNQTTAGNSPLHLLLARLLSNPAAPGVQLHNALIVSTFTSTEPQAITLLLVKVYKKLYSVQELIVCCDFSI